MCLTNKIAYALIEGMELKKLVLDLEKAGLTQSEIGSRIGCAQSTVSGWRTGARGARPAYALTKKLEDLHKKVVKKAKRKVLA